jgi:hypothetical protein
MCLIGHKVTFKNRIHVNEQEPSITSMFIQPYFLPNYVLRVSACRNHYQAPDFKIIKEENAYK